MKKRILCFGDSNTWGYIPGSGERYTEEVRWTGVLAAELGSSYCVVEEGLSGRTTVFSDMMEPERCGITHLLPVILSALPLDYMVIMLGTNDTKAHFHVNAHEIGYGMEELLIKARHILDIRGSKAQILLVSPVPLESTEDVMFDGASAEKSKRLPEVYRGLAETWETLFLDAGGVIRELGEDGIHFTEEDHRLLGKTIAAIIQKNEKERGL